jgi:hypothetical protein
MTHGATIANAQGCGRPFDKGGKDGGVYLVVSASLEEESDNALVTSLDSEVERCPVRRIARWALDVDTALEQQLDALLWIHKI